MVSSVSGISPAVSAAIGAALVFYGATSGLLPVSLSLTVYMGLFIVVATLAAFLRSLDVIVDPELQRSIRHYLRLIIAVGLGASIGLVGVYKEKQSQFIPPMPAETIQRIHLTITSDLRLLPKGSLSGQGKVQFCEDFSGRRISARGVINLIVSDSMAKLRELAGQGSTLVVEGSFLPPKEGGAEALSLQTFYVKKVIQMRAPEGFQNLRFAIRKALLNSFRGKEWGGFAAALLLGVRDDLDQEVTDLYRRSGSSHVLALSGMHLGIIAALLAFLLRRPLGFRLAAAVSLGALWFYVSLAGFQPSLTRSLIMYVLIIYCFFTGISGGLLPVIALSFLIQLVIDPLGMASLSAMLSYVALTGIVVLSPPIVDVMKGKIPEPFAGALAASLGAFTATAPLVALYFGVLYPIGILAGSLLGLMASLFMIGSILYLVLLYMLPVVSPVASTVLALIYKVHLSVLRCSSALSVEVGNLNWALAGLFSIAMAGLFVYGQYRGKTKRTISAFD